MVRGPRGGQPHGELEDLVTGAEIGRRLGVSTQRAHQLAARDDFPPAIGRVGNYVVWRWPDVDAWNARTDRSPGRRKAVV